MMSIQKTKLWWHRWKCLSQFTNIFFIGDINEGNAKELLIQLENDIHLDYNPIQLNTIEIELENDMRAIEMTPAEIDLENDLRWDPDLRTFIDRTLLYTFHMYWQKIGQIL